MEGCPHCGGRGWLPVPSDHELPRARRCYCRTVSGKEWLKRVGVPPMVLSDALDPWDTSAQDEPTELWKWAKDRAWDIAWINGGAVGWMLSGASGRGKSKAAAIALSRAGVGRWYDAHSTVRNVMDEAIESGFSPTRYALIGQPLVVIDDFGSEGNAKLTEEVRGWIWTRYTGRWPTIVTTNLRPETIDPRLRSRMADWRLVCMTGEDYRLRRALAARKVRPT